MKPMSSSRFPVRGLTCQGDGRVALGAAARSALTIPVPPGFNVRSELTAPPQSPIARASGTATRLTMRRLGAGRKCTGGGHRRSFGKQSSWQGPRLKTDRC